MLDTLLFWHVGSGRMRVDMGLEKHLHTLRKAFVPDHRERQGTTREEWGAWARARYGADEGFLRLLARHALSSGVIKQ